MGMLDKLKDPKTGQIKKPILFSLVGGAGLIGYMLLAGKGGPSGVVSTGQTTPLTPILDGLQDALKGLTGNKATTPAAGGVGGGGSGAGPSVDPPPGFGTTTTTPSTGGGGYVTPSLTSVSGSSGAGGGGGGGTGQVIQPIAKAPTVYAGLTVGQTPIVNASTGFVTGTKAIATTTVVGAKKVAGSYILRSSNPEPSPTGGVAPKKKAIATAPKVVKPVSVAPKKKAIAIAPKKSTGGVAPKKKAIATAPKTTTTTLTGNYGAR